jgi:hypothetical protein
MKIFQRIYTYEDEENFHAAMVFEGREGRRRNREKQETEKLFPFA